MSKFVVVPSFLEMDKIKPAIIKATNYDTAEEAMRHALKESKDRKMLMVVTYKQTENVFGHAARVLAFDGKLYVPLTAEELESIKEKDDEE